MKTKLDQQLKQLLIEILEQYKRKSIYTEDCILLQQIVNKGFYEKKEFITSYDLVCALENYFEKSMKSTLRQFWVFTWYQNVKDNELVKALRKIFNNYLISALTQESRYYFAVSRLQENEQEVIDILEQNQKLQKELNSTIKRLEQLERNMITKDSHIAILTKENKKLYESLTKATAEIYQLTNKLKHLEENKIPNLELELLRFNQRLLKMEEREKTAESRNPNRHQTDLFAQDKKKDFKKAETCGVESIPIKRILPIKIHLIS